jgi:hypothetical protein
MHQPQSLFLCIHSQDQLGLALDYWSGYEDNGRWTWNWKVNELSTRHGISKKEVLELVRFGVTAVDVSRRCIDCDSPEEIKSRAAFAAEVSVNYLCSLCSEDRIEQQRQEEKKKHNQSESENDEAMNKLLARNQTYEYRTVRYLDAVFAFAIMVASDEACDVGSFKDAGQLYLYRDSSMMIDLLGRLFQTGVLRILGTTPKDAVIFKSGGDLTYYPLRVHWGFARDSTGRSYQMIMRTLGEIIDTRSQNLEYEQSIAELWRSMAYDDARAYLNSEVDDYNLPEVKVGPKTEEAIWYASEHFSIPQVRRMITNVVKNAAALSQHKDFARRHALNTIPGNLIKYVDRALSESWQVSPLLRNWHNEEPILLTTFRSRNWLWFAGFQNFLWKIS